MSKTSNLPKPYELMMQKVLPRIMKRDPIYRISIEKRRSRFSLNARLSTPEGRRIILRRILIGRAPPTSFHE